MNEARIFTGSITRIDDEGQSTGIYKQLREGSLVLGEMGLEGDMQADRRVHGGPEKAVHHYPAGNYQKLAAAFPAIAEQFIPGSLGENISTAGFDENTVCIGDIFSLGEARLQISQPRSPCWKIDHRYATPGVARHVAEHGITGWYYRVLAGGRVKSGDFLCLEERLEGAVFLNELWTVWNEHRPALEALRRFAEAPGLTPGWRKKLLERSNWLLANGQQAS